jgi:NADPH-dependent 2,4-dienoyl-CoA reductase/sulfur reductase-like enzyme/peroxiredoxin family protein/rhodanese-related sulfurtransferase/TusA-related sulfurtransferase
MKVLIIGGVAAGMSTAARLRRLDERADIVVFEQGAHVSFANCGLPYHIGGVIRERDRLLVQTPESLRASLNLDVRVRTEVTAIDRAARRVTVRETATGRIYEESYDQLVLAPGALPLRPPLPGIDHPAVLGLRTLEDMDAILARIAGGARRAVVMGGYIGIEAAENLRQRGLEVTIMEKMPQLMGPLDPEMAQLLREELERHGVRVRTSCGVTAFAGRPDGVAVQLEDGSEIPADLVVLALGSVPNAALARAAGLQLGPRGGIAVNDRLQTSDPDIYAGGDAVETTDFVSGLPTYVPMAGPANRQGRIIADNLCGRDSRYRATQGTAVLKVFTLTVALTGASEKALRAAAVPYRKVYLSPSGHAGYYPGTAPMRFKLLFAPDGKRILGAQIVGCDGVDKRIDVIATAMRGNLGVWDLEHLELAYAPPYGSAKDAVNMAGFVACNLLRGDVDLWYPENFPALPPDAVLLDVRGPAEYADWHIPGATNLPLAQIRKRRGELDPARTYFIYCKVGLRSYLAYRILKQLGLRARTLSGGTDFFRAFFPELPAADRAAPPTACAPAETARAPAASSAAPAAPAPRSVALDCTGLQCPGPMVRLRETIAGLAIGDVVEISASDPGFARDLSAWCRSTGHELVEARPLPCGTLARVRKSPPAPASSTTAAGTPGPHRKTFVVFSGDLDRVMAALVLANGAIAMGDEVTLFFTFWGLSAIRREEGVATPGKSLLDRMFGWMLPRGLARLRLSQMHMAGMGTAMMKHVMAQKQVASPQELLAVARRQGLKLVACSMSMDVMGLRREELLDGVEIGGAASFLAEADASNVTLFV